MRQLVSLFFGLIGIVFVSIALYNGANTNRFLATAQSVPGTVVQLVHSTDSEGESTCVPKVRYSVNGKPYEFQGKISSNPPAYHEGQAIRVVYSPSEPAMGRIDVWWEHYFLTMIFGGLGAVFGLIGIVGILFRR